MERRTTGRPKYYYYFDLAHYVLRIFQAILAIGALAAFYSINTKTNLARELGMVSTVPITVLRLRLSPKDNVHTIIHIYTSVLSVGCYGVTSIKDMVIGSNYLRDVSILQLVLTSILTILHMADLQLTYFFSLRPVLPPPFFRSMTDFSKAYSVERETTA